MSNELNELLTKAKDLLKNEMTNIFLMRRG